jgi:two-component system OmpR family response regulator
MKVLVVEDDDKLRLVLKRGLSEEGYAVDGTGRGEEACWYAAENSYDVIVLDVGLPDLDGYAVCRRLRAGDRWAPVLMLTAFDAVEDRVQGLDVGADDYLVKPFSFPELLARLRALSRRQPVARPAVLAVGDLTLDVARREVRRGPTRVDVTPKEFALLRYLMLHAEDVVARSTLVEQVWDTAWDGDPHVVSVYIAYLREKVDRPFGRRSIDTVRGVGYRLRDDRRGLAAD